MAGGPSFVKNLSLFRCTGTAVNGLLNFVTRRTVLAWTVFELLVSIIGTWFYIKYDEVAILGAWWTMAYAAFFLIRCLSAMVGFRAAFKRKVRLTKIYYGLFFFNAIAGMVVDVPLFRLKCDCSEWHQCHALIGFANAINSPVLQPYPEPPHIHDERSSHIRYEKQPAVQETLRPGQSSFIQEESSTDNEDVELAVGVHGMRRVKHHSQEMSRNLDIEGLDNGAQRAARAHKVASREVHNATGEEAAATPQKMLQFFIPTERGLRWISTSAMEPKCQGQDVSSDIASKLVKWLEDLHAGKGARMNTWYTGKDMLGPALWACHAEEDCGVVQLQVVKRSDKYTYSVCELHLQVKPSSSKDPLEEDGTLMGHFYYQKKAGMQEEAASNKEQQEVFKEVFHGAHGDRMETKYLTMLKGANDCLCDKDSCHAHDDIMDKTQYWCWIDPSTLEGCQARGIVIYKHGSGRMWTEDLCDKCECSNQGLKPGPQDKVNPGLLWSNKLNYGAECRKWHDADAWQWCFVGFDSICVDRERAGSTGSGILAQPQYKSHLPCKRQEQIGNQKKAMKYCTRIHWFVDSTVGLLTLLSLPMTMVIFKFISNRCADEFKQEDQFVPVSTDESEAEDTWTAGQRAPTSLRNNQERLDSDSEGSDAATAARKPATKGEH
mmetsp:Transcript_65549/g.145039  ORF Transcript_65549/g.145039 Transcript_65549/m.145039 type:complete len:662 (-) Transcript_65549:14-1999(-)